MDFDEAARYLHGLTRLGIKLGNERFEALLERLGNPHRSLKAVHIAGTKGKGSTAVFASSVLRAAGYRVGTYLSPYVYDLRERVQVDGEMIPRDEFARLATRIRPVAEALADTEHGPTTEFEFKTAIGFCYFAERAVDYAVIEVGLGGRLDATNVLADTLVSVITNIGFDHTHLLGSTLREIAGEKAGIIKRGGICVTGAQAPDAFARIAEVCRDRSAELTQIVPGRDWRPDGERGLCVTTTRRSLGGLNLGVRGDFQQANAALAVHALDRARGLDIDDDAVRRGLAGARIPGRMEIVRAADPTIVVDAAHNAMAGEALSAALIHEFDAARRPLIFVVGMSKGHEPAEFLSALVDGLDLRRVRLVATEPQFRPRESSEVADAAALLGVGDVRVAAPSSAAAGLAIDMAAQLRSPLIVVTGSFYTVGELSPERWQELFAARGMNPSIPSHILDLREELHA